MRTPDVGPGVAIRGLGLRIGEERRGGVLSLGSCPATDPGLRRATRECRWALAAVEAMLEDGRGSGAAIVGEGTALLYVTAAAYAASNRAFIEGGGGTHFAYTAPPVVPAEVAIAHGLAGRLAVYIGGAPATLRAIWHAAALIEAGECERALVLAVETFDECADLYEGAGRLVRWPLVEAAACLWLEPGPFRVTLRTGRRPPRRVPVEAGGELAACGPLAELGRRRPGPGVATVLRGVWQGAESELTWSERGAE